MRNVNKLVAGIMMANSAHKIFPIIMLLTLMFPNHLKAQNYNIYFGDLHEHSTLSFDAKSGALPPGAAFTHAKNVADLDFFAITDHGNDLNNGQPLEGWQMLLATANTNTDSEFVALGSQEVGLVFASGGYGHMVIHDSPDLADNNFFPDVRFELNDIYDFIIQRQSLAHFCHPGINGDASSRFNNFAFNSQADPFMYAVEVLSGFRSTPYEKFYLLALANGWHIGAVAGQDNHSRNYGNRIDGSGNINLTGVLVDTLYREKLLDALKNRRVYAFQTSPTSDRIFLTKFTADDHMMGEIIDNDDNRVALNVAAHAQEKFISAQLYKNGHLFKKFEPNSNQLNWTPVDSVSFGSVYYFIKLVQEDTDVLWSSPIWVNSTGENPVQETEITPIAELRENLPNGLPRNLEVTNVSIRGVATVGRQFGFDGPGFLQDSTGGIAIFGSAFVEQVIPGFPLEFEVIGKLSFFNGQTEITPHSVTRLGLKSFPEIPQVSTVEIASNGEAYEGSLVQIIGAAIIGTFPAPGSNANLTIDDGSGPCTLRIDKDTNIPGTPTPNGSVRVTGVVGQFDSEPPYLSGYQLLPRSIDDLEFVTSVEEGTPGVVPEYFDLKQNYPNPFNPETEIRFQLPAAHHVVVLIFNTLGQEIRTLTNRQYEAGYHSIRWDSKDNNGKLVSSGIYLYQLQASDFVQVRKMSLIR